MMHVCLSVAYIGPKSKTKRLMKTKIGQEVAHTTFKVQRSKVDLRPPAQLVSSVL